MSKYIHTGFLLICVFFFGHSLGQTQTVGLFSHTSGSEDDGYVLFAPQASDTTYLIDKCGREVHKWHSSYIPGLDFYLLPDGTLLRAGNYPNVVFDSIVGSVGGIIERFDWNSNLLWHYVISDSSETQNHDICYMPNGNILVAIWERVTDSAAIANGRNPALLSGGLWLAKITEIQPVGTDSANIVWQWRVWDHLIQDYNPAKPNYGVVADHPELLNLNYVNTNAVAATDEDWLHLNAVTYNPALDQVMISFHNLDEIYILDHSTTSAQAGAHTGGVHNKGGDFLYRWGNPAAYGAAAVNAQFYQQHDPIWIPYGKYANQIMVFNNGNGRAVVPIANSSSVDIIAPPVDSAGNYSLETGQPYGPDTLTWTYQPGTVFYSAFEGGAQPLTNGNILICNAIMGQLFEIDSNKNIVWNYIVPVRNNSPIVQGTPADSNSVYRCLFYPASYSGFSGQTLTPGAPIELNPTNYYCTLTTAPVTIPENKVIVMPNPANTSITIAAYVINTILVTDITGRIMLNGYYDKGLTSAEVNTSQLPDGIYILCVNGSNYQRIVVRH